MPPRTMLRFAAPAMPVKSGPVHGEEDAMARRGDVAGR